MNELDIRERQDLVNSFNISKDFLNKDYLINISNNEVVPIPKEIETLAIKDNIRLFKINKLVYDKDENCIDKLSNLYNAVGNLNSSVIMILDSDGISTNLYMGTKVKKQDKISINNAKEIIERTFKGNFPGSQITTLKNKEAESLVDKLLDSNIKYNDKSISCVSGIPALKDEDKKNFVQGIEKLANTMQGSIYSAVFIADSINPIAIEDIKSGYEDLYTRVAPFLNSQLSYGKNDSEAIAKGLTTGITNTVSESISKTQSYTNGKSNSSSFSNNESQTRNSMVEGALVGGILGLISGGPAGMGIGTGIGSALGSSKNKTIGTSTSSSTTSNESQTDGSTEQNSVSTSDSKQESNSTTNTYGSSANLQVSFEDKRVKSLLEKIDNQLNRIENSKSFGMWNCASYFIADDISTSQIAASTFKSLMRGQESSIETSYINTWDDNNKLKLCEVKKYIKTLNHPLIDLGVNIGTGIPYVTPGSLISGNELAIQFGLPKKSIAGLPVMKMAEFGRNVTTYDKIEERKINLGKIFHMGAVEELDVNIDVNSLGMHTFITGSTGSGKSNTIYNLLNEANIQDVKFLVIEPAKGEYKEIFGGREDVNVFGTNPKHSAMLKVNPFRFPEDIHILEHIDRLIEIFNACWPMYAAMPAVLKEAVEMAYEKCGWDLDYSICASNKIIYPTFKELLNTLDIVIKNSGYSEEVKSNYAGALCTRVKSLTNGLLGRIFTSDEIDNEILFDENTIIDLSRIGSTETKSLISGILFIKLQEHRMTSNVECNSKLKHITVLEEAHNLLRKTSTAQSQEGSNLQGKSVEMISNSIAEMRTYGEGFIIADQAPNLLDDSAIRNTNTKIILRLPQQEDRESVGKSASLNEDQINEIPKLKTGVAVIYQNNWMEPVLCKVKEFKDKNPLQYSFDMKAQLEKDKKVSGDLIKLILNGRITDDNKIDVDDVEVDNINKWLDGKNISDYIKCIINSNLDKFKKEKSMDLWNQEHFEELCDVINSFVDKNKMTMYSSTARDMREWTDMSIEYVRNYIELERNLELEKSLLQCLLSSKSKEDENFKNFYFKWVEENRIEGGMVI